MRRSRDLLIVAGIAAAGQAVATIGTFAWLSRALPVSEVGRFGLYVAMLSFVLALDGIRQGVVVVAATASEDRNNEVTHMTAIALQFGLFVAAGIVVAGNLLLGLSWFESIPLAVTAFLLLAVSPGLARLEASGRPHWAVAIHSAAWAAALVIGAWLAVREKRAPIAAWTMLVAPMILGVTLGMLGVLTRPSFRRNERARTVASQGLRLHLATAVASFLDKGVLAGQAGPHALGLYTPLAELTGRASALGGLVSNLYLRDETLAMLAEHQSNAMRHSHRRPVNALLVMACAGIILAAILAGEVLLAFVARSSAEEVLAFRLLLASLALNLGAQWSAVTLRARGEFDLYRPYVASLLVAGLLSPWLVTTFGIVGGAMVVLVLRTADIALMFRARALLTPVQICSVATTTVVSLVIAVVGQLRG